MLGTFSWEDQLVTRCASDVWNQLNSCSDHRLWRIDGSLCSFEWGVWDAWAEKSVSLAGRVLSSGACPCRSSDAARAVRANRRRLRRNPANACVARSDRGARCCATSFRGILRCGPRAGAAGLALFRRLLRGCYDLDCGNRTHPVKVARDFAPRSSFIIEPGKLFLTDNKHSPRRKHG